MTKRSEIGDRVLVGDGFEFGAGLSPSRFAQVASLTVIDKRDAVELEALFGAPPPYEVMTYAHATTQTARDFITAHHVLEHCPDPIGVLMTWLRLLRDGGTLFVSVPGPGNSCEALREPTPVRHLISDHFFHADGEDYESRNHIPSFINQWASMNPETIWFAGGDAQSYATQALVEQRRKEGHDLHWHTFDANAFRVVVEAATYLAGRRPVSLEIIETDDELFAVAILDSRYTVAPPELRSYLDFVKDRAARMERVRSPLRRLLKK